MKPPVVREKRDGGFTLVELMISLAIYSLLSVAMLTMFLTGLQGWESGGDRMEAQQNARVAVDRVVKDLRRAEEVWLKGSSEVRFSYPGDDKTYSFLVKNSELVLEDYINNQYNSQQQIARGITGLHFELEPCGKTTVELRAGSGQHQVELRSSVLPRNVGVDN